MCFYTGGFLKDGSFNDEIYFGFNGEGGIIGGGDFTKGVFTTDMDFIAERGFINFNGSFAGAIFIGGAFTGTGFGAAFLNFSRGAFITFGGATFRGDTVFLGGTF